MRQPAACADAAWLQLAWRHEDDRMGCQRRSFSSLTTSLDLLLLEEHGYSLQIKITSHKCPSWSWGIVELGGSRHNLSINLTKWTVPSIRTSAFLHLKEGKEAQFTTNWESNAWHTENLLLVLVTGRLLEHEVATQYQRQHLRHRHTHQ